ncbi:MAG: galactose mutarotase [archaeon]|nr:galactose mutarotase [archaeon]
MATIADFGTLPDGTPVHAATFSAHGMSITVCDYGCTILSMVVPDRDGRPVDVVLGYPSLDDYTTRSGRMGATIGRFANRIAGARFTLDGKTYEVTRNRGNNHIHGGDRGFDKRVWRIDSTCSDGIAMSIVSEDGEEGYPGRLEMSVRFTLSEKGLRIDYDGVSDRDTVCNLTNHSYFNLAGEGTVDDHVVTLRAGKYTPLDGDGVPTGEIADVDEVHDLREPAALEGKRFDDNFMADGEDVATVCCDRTGIAMDVRSDLPAFQFYTADGLKTCPAKDRGTYGPRSGLCVETQFCPDSPNRPGFPSCTLRKGERYSHYTEYLFRTV